MKALAANLVQIGCVVVFCLAPAANAHKDGRLSATPEPREHRFATKRPIMQAACPTCVWGAFALTTKHIMAEYGYDIQICWNCNRDESARYVADARVPRDLTADEIEIGDPPPPNGPVDFGVTSERLALWAYHGVFEYAGEVPRRNLRLIAHFEDPTFLIVAVKADSAITDLSNIAAHKLPVRIQAGNANDAMIAPILQYYGISPKQLESWGGKFVTRQEAKTHGVDVLISRSGSHANNEESSIWNRSTWTGNWRFLTLAPDLRDKMVHDLGYQNVMLPKGYFPGVAEAIPTIERSGQAVIGRDDMPDDFAYALAKAMDVHRLEYMWSIRPFFSDPRTVWKLDDLPLHPGAERYYREAGYIK